MEFNIYGIFCRTTWKVYYGKTNLTVEKRLEIHKKDYKSYLKGTGKYMTSFEIIKNNNYEIKLLETCDDDLHMDIREGYYIKTFPCVNKNIPGRTQKEYYQDNKEKILEKKKEYCEKNKEKKKEYDKQRYEANRETILEKIKETYICPCGSVLRQDAKARHEKTNKHKKYLQSL